MRLILLTLGVIVLLTGSPLRADTTEPFATVQNLFAAIARFDYDGMRAQVTEDFQLLEVGELWNIDTLVAQIGEYEGKLARRNYFSLIDSGQDGNLAWVSYWNMARYKTAEQEANRAWIESAVLVRTDSGWKIRLLHSTAIPRDKAPEGVQFTEYVQ